MGAGDRFARLYAESYRGLMLTAYALLDDDGEAETITRDAFATAHERRAALERAESGEEWVRAVVVRLVRRRLRWRAVRNRLRRGAPAVPPVRETALRLHRLAGLPAATIASIVDTPVETVESWLAGTGEVSWASVRQPDVTRVLDRARQRVTRRRMLAGAVVAVLVVGVVVPLLRVEPEPRPAVAAPAPTPTTSTPSPVVPTDMIYGVTFVDARHGYALHARCRNDECTVDLLSTDDGEHWSRRPVPKGGAPRTAMGGLAVLGPDEVIVDWAPPETPGVAYRVHSTDGGRTWERLPTAVRGTVAAIPDGATLEHKCVQRPPWCEEARVAVVRPGSGESAWLTGVPRLASPQPGDVRAGGKYWWVVGRGRATQPWTIALSANGRTWTTTRLAWRGDATSEWWSVVASGDTVYASVTGALNDGVSAEPADYGVLAIFRSDDGGRSWTRTRGPLRRPIGGELVAGADGTLTAITQDGTTLVSRDGGRTFAEAEQRFRGWAHWTGTGYVASDASGHAIQYSTDGVHWRALDLER